MLRRRALLLAPLAAPALAHAQAAVAVTGTLGEQMLLWEHATAVVGPLLGINPFDQPDVEAAKSFYADLFGLESIPRPEIPGIAGHWFAAGDAQVHLLDAPSGEGPIRPAGDHWC